MLPLMGEELLNSVRETARRLRSSTIPIANSFVEHTLLVTETGVEVLTARKESSPGGPVPIPGV